jgi:flagellar basal-body rod protein FlgC
MAGPLSIYDIAGRAMSAQLVRLNTTASNLANAGSVSGSKDAAFRAIKPVFRSVTDAPGVATVRVDRVVASQTEPTKRHAPDHPLAAKNGDVWEAGVDSAAELVEMIETH